jgi:hypothetical protein
MNFDAFDTQFGFSEYWQEVVSRAKYQISISGKFRLFIFMLVWLSIAGYFAGTVVFMTIGINGYVSSNDRAGMAVFFMGVFLALAGFGLMLYAVKILARASLRMQRFAKINNLEFLPFVSVSASQGFAFSFTVQKFGRNLAKGVYAGRGFSLYEYRFITRAGRHAYPNIFTALMIDVGKQLPHVVVVNKKGRLKVASPKKVLNKTDLWPKLLGRVTVFSEGVSPGPAIGGIFAEKNMERLLQIYPKAELQTHGTVLTILLPEKLQPSAALARELFDFIKTIK